MLAAQSADSEPIRDLLAWIPDRLDEDLSVPRLADRTHLSERVEEIARVCGFGTPETMNRVFRRRLDITPGDPREHFGEPAVS